MPSLPNVASVLAAWSQSLTLKTVIQTTVDFAPTKTVVETTIRGVVQPTRPEELRIDQVDWSLRHYTVHTTDAIAMGQIVVYGGADYRVIQVTDWSDSGYREAVVEETRRAPEVSDG